MKIGRKTAGDVNILSFAGEFDAFNLPTISEKIDSLIQKGGTLLVFNLKELKFINSSALGYLIKTHKRLRELESENSLLKRLLAEREMDLAIVRRTAKKFNLPLKGRIG